MTAAADVLIGVIPVVLAAAFLLLIVQSMGDRATGLVDKMKQAVGGAVMLPVTLLVVFAFLGGGGGDDPGPDPPEPAEEYDVLFHVASDSQGYGTVSISGLPDVPEGTSVTVGQTITVSRIGQCAATPAADTSEYVYAFSHWTGADDSSTPAPTSITADTHYYAHFTRTEVPPEPPQTYTVSFHVASDSQGYGTVSTAGLSDVPEGASVTVGQTIIVGTAGQCAATPAASTSEYEYAFAGWTGADDSSTPAPTTITADTHYYAHFTRTVKTYTVSFHVASDSAGYGTVSVQSVHGVPYGTSVTVAQTIAVGAVGQCTATPSADTSQYSYAFAGWTGADDPSTAAPTVISGDTAYYAHFTRTAIPQPMDPSLFTFRTGSSGIYVTGWAGTPPASGYELYLPVTDQNGNQVTHAGPYSSDGSTVSPFIGVKKLSGSGSLKSITGRAFRGATVLETVYLPTVTIIGSLAFEGCTAIKSVTFGPLTQIDYSSYYSSFPDWTFYDTDGTTVLSKTPASLANSTFEGTASALIKVDPNRGLTPELEQRVQELTAEHALKKSMLEEIDPDLAELDSDDIALMTVEQIRGLTPEDVRGLKAEVERKRSGGGE